MILLILIVCFFFSCERPDNPTLFTDTAMTMEYRIMIGKSLTFRQKRNVHRLIKETFSEIDSLYNHWNPQSELSSLNRAKAGERITLSPKLARFLQETGELVAFSEGRFDPTIASLHHLWKTHLQKVCIPSQKDVQKAKDAVGWHLIHFDGSIFWKDNDAVQLDLGGIAKGYAIDLLVERLQAIGHHDVYVEWGGEIRTVGKHPDQRPWKILVTALGRLDPSRVLAVVDLHDEAVASSGDYFQKWTVNGITYCHLINPMTSHPLIVSEETVCSATVAAPTCMLADALATTAMMFPTPEHANEWLEKAKRTVPSLQYWVTSRKEASANF